MAIKRTPTPLKKTAGRTVPAADDADDDDDDAAPAKGEGEGEDENEEPTDDDADSGPSPSEDEGEGEDEGTAKPGTKVKTGAKAEATASGPLVKLFEKYDSAVNVAETYFVELVEFIQEKQLDRATVVASMMKARRCSYENAQSQYSRMKKIYNNEEVLADLKAGKINLKMAREKTKTTQANPKSSKPEAKEAKYTNTLKSFIAAAKESGLPRREILVGVEAELKAAGIK